MIAVYGTRWSTDDLVRTLEESINSIAAVTVPDGRTDLGSGGPGGRWGGDRLGAVRFLHSTGSFSHCGHNALSAHQNGAGLEAVFDHIHGAAAAGLRAPPGRPAARTPGRSLSREGPGAELLRRWEKTQCRPGRRSPVLAAGWSPGSVYRLHRCGRPTAGTGPAIVELGRSAVRSQSPAFGPRDRAGESRRAGQRTGRC